MKQETNNSFDVINLMTEGLLKKYKRTYENVKTILNKAAAVDKSSNAKTYDKFMNDVEHELQKMINLFEKLIGQEPNFSYLLEKCKEKHYELTGQIYAMLWSQKGFPMYESLALEYYNKYLVQLQKFKKHEALRSIDSIAVYSFRPFSKYALADLKNETITVARPSKMNDPFDSIADIWKKEKNLRQITKGKGHEELLERSMDYFRIRSFVFPSQYNSDESVISNIRMWSVYANEHKGFCVKYRLNEGFIHHIDTIDWSVRRLAPVKYVPDYTIDKSLTSINSYEAYNMKHESWSYENEIRLLSYNTSTECDYFSEPMGKDAEIEEIIFGLLCPPKHRKQIYNLLKNKNVKFFCITSRPKDSIYKLVKKEYIPQ